MTEEFDAESACARVHAHLAGLPAFRDPAAARAELPFADGLYFFYETGETSPHAPAGRIVRVCNHPGSDKGLWRRLTQHYSGQKNSSVFRKFLGGALLRREQPDTACLQPAPGKGHWERQHEPVCSACHPYEQRVSTLLRDVFFFRCIRVTARVERNRLEPGLIASFAACAVCVPSAAWLGRYAYHANVRRSGLWNSRGMGGPQLTADDLARLEALITEGAVP